MGHGTLASREPARPIAVLVSTAQLTRELRGFVIANLLEAKSCDATVDTCVAAQCQPCGPTPTSMTPRLLGVPNSSRHPISVGVISVKTHVAAKRLTSSIGCGDGLAHQPRRTGFHFGNDAGGQRAAAFHLVGGGRGMVAHTTCGTPPRVQRAACNPCWLRVTG